MRTRWVSFNKLFEDLVRPLEETQFSESLCLAEQRLVVLAVLSQCLHEPDEKRTRIDAQRSSPCPRIRERVSNCYF